MDDTFEIEAAALAQVLDELDYFQILKIGQGVSPMEIKSAYYRESRGYHPDRFYQLKNLGLKESIGRIYKRINEAYVCLRDDVKRAKYLADISGPERNFKMALTYEPNNANYKSKRDEAGKLIKNDMTIR